MTVRFASHVWLYVRATLFLGVLTIGCAPLPSPTPVAGETPLFPTIRRPPNGALQALGPERTKSLLLAPLKDRYSGQFGPLGLTAYVAPSVQTRGETASPGIDQELRVWLERPRSPTLAVLGQDTAGGEALLAHLSRNLATAGMVSPTTAVPLVLELCELIPEMQRGTPVNRVELAIRALARLSAMKPTAPQVEADLLAGALLLLVTDFDRYAELLGPAGAQRTLEALSQGPGKLLLRARPVWFGAASAEDRELTSTGSTTLTRSSAPLGAPPLATVSPSGQTEVARIFLRPLSFEELSKTATNLHPIADLNWEARLSAYPALRTLARHPALTTTVLDSFGDRVLLDPLRQAPDRWHLLEGWTRFKLEASLGEGQVSAVERLETALGHLARRLYQRGRLELPPEGPEEAALKEEVVLRTLCSRSSFLICSPGGYRFNQTLMQDYFAARGLREGLTGSRAPSPSLWTSTLDGRRPGAGTLAFLASGLDDIPGADDSIRTALATGQASPFVLEALLRLRVLREGLAGADGDIVAVENLPVEPVVAHAKEGQAFWRQWYAEENERVRKTGSADLTKFLKSREGRRYSRIAASSSILKDRDGSTWAYVPSGRGIAGSYLSSDEDPVRWIESKEPFLLELHLVSNEQFQKFVQAGVYQPHPPWIKAEWARFLAAWRETPDGRPDTFPEGRADHPVINVSWEDARAYCAWRSTMDKVTSDLPQEDEWEFAARALLGRLYPWGDRFEAERGNTSEGGQWQTTPVNRYSGRGEGPFGNLDLAGNVWEWTASTFDRGGVATDQSGRALHGGGWRSAPPDVRSSRRLRAAAQGRYDVVGFRLKRKLK